MQIRLTVVDPLGPHAAAAPAGDRAARCDVLVTAPAGTALAAVASALAAALPGEGPGSGQVVLYAGAQRLDAQRSTLGEPPLIDGAVLFLGAPGEPDPHTEPADVPAQLHVVAGPDAGGVHLLHGGQIRLGRSADADVALDDPDVSRMHCAVTVGPDARVSVADLGSTNGTTLDGARVGDRPVRFAPGALLRIGESALRLVPVPPAAEVRVETAPDGEGHVRLSGLPAPSSGGGEGDAVAHARVADGTEGQVRDAYGRSRATDPTHGPAGRPSAPDGPTGFARVTGAGGGAGHRTAAADGTAPDTAPHGTGPDGAPRPHDRTHHAYGTSGYATGRAPAEPPQVPGQGGAPRIESHGTGPTAGLPRQAPTGGETHGGARGAGAYASGGPGADAYAAPASRTPDRDPYGEGTAAPDAATRAGAAARRTAAAPGRDDGVGPDPRTGRDGAPGARSGCKGTPLRGTDVPQEVRRRGGIGAWARRLTGGRGAAPEATVPGTYPPEGRRVRTGTGVPVRRLARPGDLAGPRVAAADGTGTGTAAVGARPGPPGGADRAARYGRPGGAGR
ncbi:FHA domain-containing protein [Streptomyces ambofaciens]